MQKKPIFILGAHKSGTSLFRSLFDGHEEVFVVPVEAHFFQHLRWWVDYSLRKTMPANHSVEDFKANIKNWIMHCNTSEHRQADSVAKGIFNVQLFNDYIDSRLQNNMHSMDDTKSCIGTYIQGIYYSLNGTEMEDGRRIVEKSVENAEFALDLQAMFPDAVFLHILRNPYANLVSLRKYISSLSNDRYPRLSPLLKSLYNSYYFLYRNRRLIKNYYVIKYEALTDNPEPVINFICRVTNLKFEQTLLKPTFLGNSWNGNSTSPVLFNSISPNRIDSWKNEITPLEAEIINKYLKHVVKDFSYDVYTTDKSVFTPIKKEPLKVYIANRIYWRIG